MKGDLREALSGLAVPDERFLFFDYDGTLSPIASRAAVAFTQPGALEELETLAQRPATRVGIVTGRPLEEIRSRIPNRSLFFCRTSWSGHRRPGHLDGVSGGGAPDARHSRGRL